MCTTAPLVSLAEQNVSVRNTSSFILNQNLQFRKIPGLRSPTTAKIKLPVLDEVSAICFVVTLCKLQGCASHYDGKTSQDCCLLH